MLPYSRSKFLIDFLYSFLSYSINSEKKWKSEREPPRFKAIEIVLVLPARTQGRSVERAKSYPLPEKVQTQPLFEGQISNPIF